MHVLTVNAGSSSLRLTLYRNGNSGLERLRSAHYAHEETDAPGIVEAFLGETRPDAVAHRIVHGGGRFGAACRIVPEVEREIERCAVFAPLHNPPALRWLRVTAATLGPEVPQIAAFDTAFFHDLPAVAAHYALPERLNIDSGLRRYGFHGHAHRAMSRAWQALRPDLRGGGRVISLQLGAGCSITAVAEGRAVDTSMGFTPLEGLVMATRCGDIDPGLLIHLQRAHGIGLEDLEHLLTHESGLAGMTGTRGDMRELLASGDPRAGLAVGMFCYRARKYVGAYLAVLGGADAILFGGGIGEHSPAIRRRILLGMEGFGIVLDNTRNDAAIGTADRIGAEGGAVDLRVIAVDEAQELARAAVETLDLSGRE